jgi:hypothetical protein
VRDPGVLVLALSAIQLGRDFLALLRDRSARPETRLPESRVVVIFPGEIR